MPIPQADLSLGLCDRYAERGVAVQHGGADLAFGDLLSKPRAMRLCPSSFTQCIFVSARLRRWYPLQFRQMARPRYFDARRASFRAMAPAVEGFHGLAFLRGGLMACAPVGDRVMALARVVGAICCHISDLHAGGIWLSNTGSMGASPPSTGSSITPRSSR